MKKILVALTLCSFLLAPGLAVCGDDQSEWTGNANLLVGKKMLDDGDWKPIEDQLEFGALFDFRKKDWPVSIAADILFSYDDDEYLGQDVEGNTLEFNLGVRKIFEGTNFQPFIGGGLAVVRAEFEGSSASDNDTGIGVWADCGVKYLLADQISIGLDLRYSYAEVTLFGVDGKAGGFHIGGSLGYHW